MSLDARYVVKPVRKALQLLDELAAESRSLTLSELSERTALPKTTAFRYLYTLRAAGLVIQTDDGDAYAIGPRLAAVAAPAAAIETPPMQTASAVISSAPALWIIVPSPLLERQ